MLGPDLECRLLDRLDDPPGRKRRLELGRGDAPRALRAGLLVAEAKKKQPPAGLEHVHEPFDVAFSIVVTENVKEPAVDDAVELRGFFRERERVLHDE